MNSRKYLKRITVLLWVTLFAVATVQAGAEEKLILCAGVTVELGIRNNSQGEFNMLEVMSSNDYTWTLSNPVDPGQLPAYLNSIEQRYRWNPEPGAVNRLTIRFATDESVHAVELEVVKNGEETLWVDFDGDHHTFYAHDVGSHEGMVFGVVKLRKIVLTAGLHSFSLSLVPNGIGNGQCGIDAIKLSAE